MKYYIQSYVDLITNSSTSIFTWATNPKAIEDIINAILKTVKSKLTCKDLFTIEVEYDTDIYEFWDDYIEIAQKEANNHPELKALLVNTDSREAKELIYSYLIKNNLAKDLNAMAEKFNEDALYKDRCPYSSHYVIKSKNPKNKEFALVLNKINDLFNYDAMYNG